MLDLDRVRELGVKEHGLAVALTTRPDGSAHGSVVNAGVLEHPVTGDAIVGFVSRGVTRKLEYLRLLPRITVVFRSGWDWATVEGTVQLAGPDDHLEGFDLNELPRLLPEIYAAAAGGSPDEWVPLDAVMREERHVAALILPVRIYSSPFGSGA